MAEVTQEQVVEYIKGISVIELSQLVKELEEELGVSAAAAMPIAVAGAASAGGGAAAEEEPAPGHDRQDRGRPPFENQGLVQPVLQRGEKALVMAHIVATPGEPLQELDRAVAVGGETAVCGELGHWHSDPQCKGPPEGGRKPRVPSRSSSPPTPSAPSRCTASPRNS